MSETTILWIVNLALSAPDLAMKIQRLFLVKNPTQADWDAVWTDWNKTPAQFLAEARARLAAVAPPPVPTP